MQSRYWCVTDYKCLSEEEWRERLNDRDLDCGIAQPEVCPETKREHVQAFVVFPHNWRIGRVRDKYPGAHVEVMRARDPHVAWNYCKKDESWAGTWRLERGELPEHRPGKRSDLEIIRDLVKEGKAWVAIVDHVPSALRYFKEVRAYRAALLDAQDVTVEEVCLRSWQREIFGLLDGPVQTRRIFWIWSPLSGVGKSTTMRVYSDMHKNTVLVGCRKLSDLMHAYDGATHRVIWYDLARSDPLDAEMTSVLETLSNGGMIFSGKYESCQKRVRCHIVVTTNRPPPDDRLPLRCVSYRLNQAGERTVEVAIDVDANGWLNPDW